METQDLLGDCAICDADKHMFLSTPDGCVLEAPELVCRDYYPLLAQVLRGCAVGVSWKFFDKGCQPPAGEGMEVDALDSVPKNS